MKKKAMESNKETTQNLDKEEPISNKQPEKR
jgi:hypothetical protein